MKSQLTALMAAAMIATTAVAADDPAKQAEAWMNHFKKADTNNSGGLSKVELDKTRPNEFASIKRQFARMDTNRDGQVTPKEYAEFVQKRQTAWTAAFKAADLNGSNGLSRPELDKTKPNQFSDIKKHFDTMDANKDGQVSIEERNNYKPRPSSPTPTVDWESGFKKSDLNDSGGLSKMELGQTTSPDLADMKQNFDKIDTNRDGQVTAQEYKAYLSGVTATAAPAPAAAAEEDDDTSILPFLNQLFSK